MLAPTRIATASSPRSTSIAFKPMLNIRGTDGTLRKVWIQRASADIAALSDSILGKSLRFAFSREGSRVSDVVLPHGRIRILECDEPSVSERATTLCFSFADQTQRACSIASRRQLSESPHTGSRNSFSFWQVQRNLKFVQNCADNCIKIPSTAELAVGLIGAILSCTVGL